MDQPQAINAGVAAAIMQRMAERKVSPAELADAIGISEKALTRRFVSSTQFKLPELVAIAAHLECGWVDFMSAVAA